MITGLVADPGQTRRRANLKSSCLRGVFIDDRGRMCKLKKAGIAYEVDADGVRKTKRGTTRPPTFDSKEWWGLSDAVKKGIKGRPQG